jgi:hypothetical protein
VRVSDGGFFLKNSKEMSNENLSMRKAAPAAMPSGPVPCVAPAGSARQRVEIYDPREGKKRKLNPYSANAKELYRFYIRELGFDETWIAPLDLPSDKITSLVATKLSRGGAGDGGPDAGAPDGGDCGARGAACGRRAFRRRAERGPAQPCAFLPASAVCAPPAADVRG